MEIISINEIEGIRIGQAEDAVSGTGCTVFIADASMAAGLDVRGGGPASRESELLKPLAAAHRIHALILSGGSAFGLDAAGGVMKYLEELGIGYDTGAAKIPLVCQSCLYDLGAGDASVRPDKWMAYEACLASEKRNYRDGNFGAGTGATVGKMYGIEYAMKTGIGSFAVKLGDLQVGAVAAVNSYGDIFEWKTGRQLAGLLDTSKTGFRSTADEMYKSYNIVDNKFTGNTTLGAIITNAEFDKIQLSKIAGLAHNGYARAIRPVHTSADGDSIYALSTGSIKADMDMVGTLAADVMAEAIAAAAKSAESAYGLPASRDILK